MRVLLFGANGQVGAEIRAAANPPGVELIAASRADADLLVDGAAAAAIARARPALVINAAAWTAVDKAETEAGAAERINAAAVAEIAAACNAMGARLIQISTDYVFDGAMNPAPLTEDAPVRPLNVYGATKLACERAALSLNAATIVLRTSWVYSVHGANFVKTMLRLGASKSEIGVVADQIGGPTPASAIAKACLEIAAQPAGPSGIFHFQGRPAASWADFAEAIFAAAGLSTRVRKIPTADYPTPARRPLDTVLDCRKIRDAYGVDAPDWRLGLPEIVARISGAA